MVKATRTTNPLHFEDLEPHRFEDLVRQLSYEFKPWRKLEATGRSGSDAGFDARGLEMVTAENLPDEDDDNQPSDLPAPDRQWLIQCKREKEIGPKALVGYVDVIPSGERSGLHGVIFAAACDFSKASRDAFDTKCREFGFTEWHLWGKAELEDMLFQPKNDHLLFAYFGFSLVIRQRSMRAEVRGRLATKRKAYRILEDKQHQLVLLRDAKETRYPFSSGIPNFKRTPPWIVRRLNGFKHDGIEIVVRRYFAYFDSDDTRWDAAFALNQDIRQRHEDPWANEQTSRRELETKIREFWNTIPEENRAWYELTGIVPYESIVDIDEHGDEVVRQPHIYVIYGQDGPYLRRYAKVQTMRSFGARHRYCVDDTADRIEKFPDEYRFGIDNPKPSTPVTQGPNK